MSLNFAQTSMFSVLGSSDHVRFIWSDRWIPDLIEALMKHV